MGAEPRNMLIGMAPEAQFVGHEKLNSFLVRFPFQWHTIFKGMASVTIETPTLFATGNEISTGCLYLARLQTLFSMITSVLFPCVWRSSLTREDIYMRLVALEN